VVGRTRRSERPGVLYLGRCAGIDSTTHRLPFPEQVAQAIKLALDLINHAATRRGVVITKASKRAASPFASPHEQSLDVLKKTASPAVRGRYALIGKSQV